MPERKSGQQLCPKDSWKQAQLQLGLCCLPRPLRAFPSFPLNCRSDFSPRGVHSLRTSASLHGTSVQVRKGAAPEAVSQLQSLVSRRRLCEKKKAFHLLGCSPMPGPKVWSAKASEMSAQSPLCSWYLCMEYKRNLVTRHGL